MKTANLNIRVRPEVLKGLRTLADGTGFTQTKLVEDAIQLYRGEADPLLEKRRSLVVDVWKNSRQRQPA